MKAGEVSAHAPLACKLRGSPNPMLSLTTRSRIAAEFQVSPEVLATFEERLAAGDPIPFLARRFPDTLGELDATALRRLRYRLEEARDVELRRANLLKTIEGLGEGGEAQKALALAAIDRWQLEDVAAKTRKPKGTRGAEASVKGLDELVALILAVDTAASVEKSLDEIAAPFVSEEKGVATAQEALHGAAAIVAERYAMEYDVRQRARREMRERGEIVSKVFDASKPGSDRYKEFFDRRERGKAMSPRRYLKLRQAEKEKILKFTVEINVDEVVHDLEAKIAGTLADGASENARAIHEFKKNALRDAVARILVGALEVDVRTEWKERADLDTLGFLRRNLRSTCMAPPYGARVVMGVDPGARKGIRVAVVAADGSLVADASWNEEGDERPKALAAAAAFLNENNVRAIAVTDTTEGDATVRFFRDAIAEFEKMTTGADGANAAADSGMSKSATPGEAATGGTTASADAGEASSEPEESEDSLANPPEGYVAPPEILRITEIGVSAIANSPFARDEFGDKPVPVRAAVTMGRRLQDPLAEFARLDPKLLADYHHSLDVAKGRLDRMLNEEFDACVHEVPIDLNSAPAPLLAIVGGMGIENAKRIIEWRKANGKFPSRLSLARVEGLSEDAYQRSVAFLRVFGSADPIDETGVHPAHAPAVQKFVEAAGVQNCNDLTHEALRELSLPGLADETAPLAVVSLVRELLMDRSRDPRGAYKPTVFNEGIRTFGDVKPGMTLDGVVRGIAKFGVFVDIGIGQDGLIHVSELADEFVKDAGDVVNVGDRVKVRVIEPDAKTRKIALTMRSEESRQKAEEEKAKRRADRQAARERARERKRHIAEMRQRDAERRAAQEAAEKARAEGGAPQEGASADGAASGEPRPVKSYDLIADQKRRASTAQRVAVARRDGIAGNRGGNRRGGPGGGPGGRGKGGQGGRRDGRFRDQEEEGDVVRGDAAPRAEAAPPPANPFKKFFTQKGLIEEK